MNEQLLQFIWRHRYFNQSSLQTISGSNLQIIYPGLLNANQGPDFLDAKIHIDHVLLAGSVELHLRSSDWKKHGHGSDVRYSNVILHVVWEYDGHEIPFVQVLELKTRVAGSMLSVYNQLMQSGSCLPCEKMLSNVNEMVWTSWKERMLAERMEQRNQLISERLERNKGDVEEVFWQTMACSWGIPLNGDLFEAIALSLPVSLLSRYRYRIHQIEALLFGQAGLLNEDFEDPYPVMLKKEYLYLKRKHNLRQADGSPLFLRMRPPEFPTVRLAQLAMLIHQRGFFFSVLKAIESVNDCLAIFQVTANDFWHRHYTFKRESVFRPKQPGKETIHRVLINAVIPILYQQALIEKNDVLRQRVISWLFELPPEQNKWIRIWEQADVGCRHAFDTQALLELTKNYCVPKRCLECAIGNTVINIY